MMLDQLKPTERRRVYDLLSEAGIDTRAWADYSGDNPAANPKYCYQWAFEGDRLTVLNVWHRDLRSDMRGIYATGNMRLRAAQEAKGVRRSRAVEFDRAVRKAFRNETPLRLIICDGPARTDERAARAQFRLLDDRSWIAAEYEESSGQFVLLRGDSSRTLSAYLPEEIPPGTPLREGSARPILVNAYERSSAARKQCLDHYGAECSVCGTDFGKVYGPIAAGYMHVHHVTPLSAIGVAYEVDPIADLRPVCPNCHAVIHLGGECRSIEEVVSLLRGALLEA